MERKGRTDMNGDPFKVGKNICHYSMSIALHVGSGTRG